MAETLSKGKLFDPELVTELISKVKGKSSLVNLSKQKPIKFNGQKEFIFSMDGEMDIVAENGKKTPGGIKLEPITIVPIKFEYGARVSDEFLYGSEEAKIDITKQFIDGFAKKVARALDIAAFHGLNPRTGEASTVVGDNNFDSKVTQTVVYAKGTPDDCIDKAIEMVEASDNDVTGIVINSDVRSDLSAMRNTNGERAYPEFKFGGKPSTLGAQSLEINKTVAWGSNTKDKAIMGDFENMFKWGYAKEIPFEVIPYGDPDNSGKDLKGYNQVYLRSEVYLGWGIFDASSFARVVTE